MIENDAEQPQPEENNIDKANDDTMVTDDDTTIASSGSSSRPLRRRVEN